MNKKLIEALTLLLKYQNTDNVVSFPARCLCEELIINIDDINKVSYEDMMKLRELQFIQDAMMISMKALILSMIKIYQRMFGVIIGVILAIVFTHIGLRNIL